MVSASIYRTFVVGLVPRFAGADGHGLCEIFYEECLIFGAVLADMLSVFPIKGISWKQSESAAHWTAGIDWRVCGHFCGGACPLALSEVLDGIRYLKTCSSKWGVSIAVLMVAVGKIAGSIVYFVNGFLKGYREENMDDQNRKREAYQSM